MIRFIILTFCIDSLLLYFKEERSQPIIHLENHDESKRQNAEHLS